MFHPPDLQVIYIIWDGRVSQFKIGRTANLPQRLHKLRNGDDGRPWQIVAVKPVGYISEEATQTIEEAYQAQFREYHVRSVLEIKYGSTETFFDNDGIVQLARQFWDEHPDWKSAWQISPDEIIASRREFSFDDAEKVS